MEGLRGEDLATAGQYVVNTTNMLATDHLYLMMVMSNRKVIKVGMFPVEAGDQEVRSIVLGAFAALPL